MISKLNLPKIYTLNLKILFLKKVRFIIYADFKCLLKKVAYDNLNRENTKKIKRLVRDIISKVTIMSSREFLGT